MKKALDCVSDYQLESACKDAPCIAPSTVTKVFCCFSRVIIIITAEREAVSNVLQQAASDFLGFCSRKHRHWFDDNCIGIRELLKARNDAYTAKLQNPSSVSLHQEWKALRSSVQEELRQMENTWWLSTA